MYVLSTGLHSTRDTKGRNHFTWKPRGVLAKTRHVQVAHKVTDISLFSSICEGPPPLRRVVDFMPAGRVEISSLLTTSSHD